MSNSNNSFENGADKEYEASDDLLYSTTYGVRKFHLAGAWGDVLLGVMLEETVDSFLIAIPARLYQEADSYFIKTIEDISEEPFVRFMKSEFRAISFAEGIHEKMYLEYLRTKAGTIFPDLLEMIGEDAHGDENEPMVVNAPGISESYLKNKVEKAIAEGCFNHTVLLLDELGQLDPREAGDCIYTLGNGQAKARANIYGDAREIATWRLLFISNGEIGLEEHVISGGERVRAGMEVRMLDIPSDANKGMGVFENIHGAPSPRAFADSLQVLSETYYGSPADALLSRITAPGELDRAAEFIRQHQEQFVKQCVPDNAHGQVIRAASRLGAVAGVGEYCISIGILPWEVGHAIWGVSECFSAWLDARGNGSASEENRALSQVREYIERNGESRFTLIAPNGIEDNVGPRTINRAGFRKILDDGATEYWAFKEMYESEICNGLDARTVTRVLVEKGHLAVDSAGKASIPKKLPGMGNRPVRVYVIKSSIMQSGGGE